MSVSTEGRVMEFPVIKIAEKDIVDTNGAGDAFVGGKSITRTCQCVNSVLRFIFSAYLFIY